MAAVRPARDRPGPLRRLLSSTTSIGVSSPMSRRRAENTSDGPRAGPEPCLDHLPGVDARAFSKRTFREAALRRWPLILGLLVPVCAAATEPTRAETERWMIEQARAWANQACGGPWVIAELFADDFRGTSPKGARYDKPTEAPVFDASTQWSSDCRLDAAEVRFFGPDVAVMYGAESKTVPLPDGKTERRCLAWTDTWMRRNQRWQIIAVQDNRVECGAE